MAWHEQTLDDRARAGQLRRAAMRFCVQVHVWRARMKCRLMLCAALVVVGGLLSGCIVAPPRRAYVAVAPAPVRVRVWVPGYWAGGVWVGGYWRYRYR
jgi:hypothetical protein